MPNFPHRLATGDVLGVVAPASAPPDPQKVEQALELMESLGFRIKRARNVWVRRGYLAGSDRERAEDLMRMFADRSVRGIICVRGGYGTARLLSHLDYRVIRAHPKIFIGYSDITSLHCAFLTHGNLVSFHGPMLNSDFSDPEMPRFTRDHFLRVLGQPVAAGDIAHGYRRRTVKVLRAGRTRGRLIGGNLSLLCTTVGTPWQPGFRNAILFLEDVNEEPYRFDRMLTHLLNAGLLQQVAGVALGLNHACEDPKAKTAKEYRQTLEDVLRERLLPLKVPVVMGLPFGHVPHNATLPVGGHAELDGDEGRLLLIEPAVW